MHAEHDPARAAALRDVVARIRGRGFMNGTCRPVSPTAKAPLHYGEHRDVEGEAVVKRYFCSTLQILLLYCIK